MRIAKIYKVKAGKLDIWKAWCQQLNTTLKAEAIETLKEENGFFESFVNFPVEETWYTLGISVPREGQELIPVNKDREINQRHRAVKKECLETVSEGELGYVLTI